MVDLNTEAAGIELENPILLASGILDQTAGSMRRVVDSGMGGVVTKSIGSEPREGHPNPTLLELAHGLLNAMGLPNPGIENFLTEIDELKDDFKDTPIIGSVFAGDRPAFEDLSSDMEEAGVDAVELNFSCPHAGGYGAAIGTDAEIVEDITSGVKENTDIPVFIKLPPIHNIKEIGLAAQAGGADALVAINTVKAMDISFEARRPVLGNEVGGYSGPAVKPIGLRCTFELFEEVEVPIIGCGGITYGRDALEYILAGASALQVGSAIHYRGVETGNKITEEMKELMEDEGISNIQEIIGKAHNN